MNRIKFLHAHESKIFSTMVSIPEIKFMQIKISQSLYCSSGISYDFFYQENIEFVSVIKYVILKQTSLMLKTFNRIVGHNDGLVITSVMNALSLFHKNTIFITFNFYWSACDLKGMNVTKWACRWSHTKLACKGWYLLKVHYILWWYNAILVQSCQ